MTPSPSPDPRNEDACRQVAGQLQHDHPRWLVMWGCYTRCYVAFPLFTASRGTVLTAVSPGEMAERMRRAEQAAGMRVPPSPPGNWPAAPGRPGPPGRPPPPGRQGGPGPQRGPGPGGWPGRQ